MTSELSFLIELLLKHKLPSATLDLIAERIKDVEVMLTTHRSPMQISPKPAISLPFQQAPSTQALLDKHAAMGIVGPVSEPQPVAVIAQTQAAAAAMASRQQAIAESIAGKTDKTTGRPRKF